MVAGVLVDVSTTCSKNANIKSYQVLQLDEADRPAAT